MISAAIQRLTVFGQTRKSSATSLTFRKCAVGGKGSRCILVLAFPMRRLCSGGGFMRCLPSKHTS